MVLAMVLAMLDMQATHTLVPMAMLDTPTLLPMVLDMLEPMVLDMLEPMVLAMATHTLLLPMAMLDTPSELGMLDTAMLLLLPMAMLLLDAETILALLSPAR